MYATNIAKVLNQHNLFERGSRLVDFFSLSIKSAMHKKKEDNYAFSYFLNLLKKEAAVIDTGYHTCENLYLLAKMAKRAGKVIALESEPATYNYLLQKKQILKWNNVAIEQFAFSGDQQKMLTRFSLPEKNGATVIDFKTRINKAPEEVATALTIDGYCIANNIHPGFLKINTAGHELTLVEGAVEVLRKHRPTIMIECEERQTGRENILKTFALLTDLKYSGYFILDMMKIPLVNFDFNIYQNPLTNFYCKDFIFEYRV
ncbi:FkbM family methyltransferase [Segetibacter koreensis]|uniref:FkbM family methyltransferase n=1 Tax=Segetibacter koreensis TaxID=398037 RepID=UPI000378787D|nr:FkbM family methyltransferase [Segetibacter koreensis]